MTQNVSVGDVVVCEGTMPIPGRKDGATREAPLGSFRVEGFFGNYARLSSPDQPGADWAGWPAEQLLAHERAPQ